jgi:hypothetical protein
MRLYVLIDLRLFPVLYFILLLFLYLLILWNLMNFNADSAFVALPLDEILAYLSLVMVILLF